MTETWPSNDPGAPIDRDRQIELMRTAKERIKADLDCWMNSPEVQKALRRRRDEMIKRDSGMTEKDFQKMSTPGTIYLWLLVIGKICQWVVGIFFCILIFALMFAGA